jgi:sugar-specific transcriptional regulator TrmB
MNIEQDLKEFGLKKSEIAVYCYLLEHNHATPTQIAKGTGILRTNCYHVLSGLVESGLIREEVGGTGRKMYFANDPESLLRATQKRAAAIERVIPDIRAMFSEKTNKPSVRFYDGKKEIQEIYRASLDAGEVFAVGSTARLQEVMPEFLPWYFAQLKKRRVALYDIVSASSRLITRDVARVALTDYAPKFLPERYKDLPTDILVWDDNVALITLEEPYFGTVLHNAPLAQTMRMILGLLGERL